MKKGMLVLALSFVLISMSISMVSAGIFFSVLDNEYNLGDMINLDITVDPVEDGRLLEVNLICEGSQVINFNNFPESGFVNIKLPLNQHTLDQVSGNCYFDAFYSSENRQTPTFEISKRLNVKLFAESFFVYPRDEITVSGTAERLNGLPINGEVEITIPLLKILETIEVEKEVGKGEVVEEENVVNGSEVVEEEVVEGVEENEEIVEEELVVEETTIGSVGVYNGRVDNGEFAISFVLKENTPAGNYRIDVLVFEEVAGSRASEGVSIANLEVFQILNGVDIALSNQNFDPGENIDFNVGLLDQTGGNIDKEVSIIIRREGAERIYEKIIKSRDTISYGIPTNSSSGYYEIEARSGDFNQLASYYVNEKAIASFVLENQTLVVTNIGNIYYDKDIEVQLNGKSFVKAIKLDIGETKRLKLTGSNEEYNVIVSDGDSEISQQGVVLTGRVVNVNAINENGVVRTITSPIFWIFIIVVLGIGVLFLFRNIFKKKSYAHFKDKFKKKKVVDLGVKDEKVVEKKGEGVREGGGIKNDSVNAKAGKAEHVLVLKGHKNKASVLALKIKNKISDHSKKSLEMAIKNVYEKKGAVYEQGDFIYVIFSSLMTRSEKNEVEAARAAEKIVKILNEHNKKFADKIDYGIGINSGMIINKIEDNKLKFTTLGNFVVVARKLAESSDKQILVTKEAYERGISEIKADKKRIGDGDVYEVRRVVDSEKNKKFIKGFLERMNKDK